MKMQLTLTIEGANARKLDETFAEAISLLHWRYLNWGSDNHLVRLVAPKGYNAVKITDEDEGRDWNSKLTLTDL